MSTTLYGAVPTLPPNYRIFHCCVSGGTLEGCLKSLLRHTGGNLCVQVSPVYMDFPLPCPTGIGTPLTEADALANTQELRTFFSPALQTCYSTMLRDGVVHTILLDTPDTLAAKCRLAQKLNVPYIWLPDKNDRKNAPQNAGRETHICEDQ